MTHEQRINLAETVASGVLAIAYGYAGLTGPSAACLMLAVWFVILCANGIHLHFEIAE